MIFDFNKILTRPDRIFRGAGLLACAITGINLIFTHLYVGPGTDMPGVLDSVRQTFNLPLAASTMVLIDVIAFTVFGWAFWRNMDSERLLAPDRFSVWLLVLQSILGLIAAPALFFMVAAEVAFVLKPRRAFIWVIALTVAAISVMLILPVNVIPGVVPEKTLSASGPPPLVALLVQCLMYPMILFFSHCLGLVGATEWRNRRELTRVNAELKATQELQADGVRLAERLHISRELHDAIGHHLAALSVNLQLASRLAEGEAARPVSEAHLIARTLLADVREVVGSLRHDSSINLRRALETLAAGITYPKVHIEISDEVNDADPLQAHTLFRCAQEIITNAVRHSGARNLWLTLWRDEAGILLQARDDGHGTEVLQPGNGLRGMRERVEEYGGELRVETKFGDGFAAKIYLPCAGGAR